MPNMPKDLDVAKRAKVIEWLKGLREQEFMQATEALGLKDRRKIFRHLLPNFVLRRGLDC